MRIILTGSLGSISKPLALAGQGHGVTVISSHAHRQKEIEALGVIAAIGSIDDVDFLIRTFTGADVAYLMEHTVNLFDPTVDLLKHYERICKNKYVQRHLNLKRIVHLSRIGGFT